MIHGNFFLFFVTTNFQLSAIHSWSYFSLCMAGLEKWQQNEQSATQVLDKAEKNKKKH